MCASRRRTEKKRRRRQRCMHTYILRLSILPLLPPQQFAFRASNNTSSSSRRIERKGKKRQIRLHCDEDDGGDGFLMVLTGTLLYYQERGGMEKWSVPYLGRWSLRIHTIDRLEKGYKDAHLTSKSFVDYVLFLFLFLLSIKKNLSLLLFPNTC
jgi:hypothetical protein